MSNGLGRGLSSLIPNKNQMQSAAGPKGFTEAGLADVQLGERVYQISPAKIKPNPLQPRESFDSESMKELTDSIKQYGIIEPLIATGEPDGSYQLVAGERRLRAAQELGLKTVPVILRTTKDMERLELSLIENIQRQDLNPIERARAYAHLLEDFGLTHEELAKRIGKSRWLVTSTLQLLRLPDEIRQALIEGRISEGHGRALLTVNDPYKQITVFQRILGKKLSVRETEHEAVEISNRKVIPRRVMDPNVLAKEEQLQSVLGTRVYIRKRGERGTILIEFYSEEELNGIVDAITNQHESVH